MKKSKIEAFKKNANNERLEDYAVKKVILCGDTVIVKAAKRKRCNTISHKKGSSNDKETSKPRNLNKSKSRIANKRTLINSLLNARLIILKNFSGAENEVFVTLTCAKPQRDVQKMQESFKTFWRKFKRAYPDCAYVRIAEPNDFGAWHFHVFIKGNTNEKLVIDTAELRKLWGHGGVNVKRIYSIDGLANYIIPSESDWVKEKARTKYKRLKFYPKGFNAYSCSKDIVFPEEIEMTDEQLVILLPNLDLQYAHLKDVVMTDEDGKKRLLNTYLFQEYKRNNSLMNQISKPELSGNGKEVDE